jgi:polyisoprenoid-binding protein YceI
MRSWFKIAVMLGTALIAARGLAEWPLVKLDRVHSRIGFNAATPLFDVTGQFKEYELRVDGDPSRLPRVQVKLSIDALSVDTGNPNRDAHIAGPNFLDAKRFPHIVFTSERISQRGDTLSVRGTLALHGKEKRITIPFKMVTGKNGAGMDATSFRAKLTIQRKDYEVGAASVAAELSLKDAVAIDLLLVWLR